MSVFISVYFLKIYWLVCFFSLGLALKEFNGIVFSFEDKFSLMQFVEQTKNQTATTYSGRKKDNVRKNIFWQNSKILAEILLRLIPPPSG